MNWKLRNLLLFAVLIGVVLAWLNTGADDPETASPEIADELSPEQQLAAEIELLAGQEPVTSSYLTPILPPSELQRSAKYADVLMVQCDGVMQQIPVAGFAGWIESMQYRGVNELKVVSSYNPHSQVAMQDLLGRLSSWRDLRILDLGDCRGFNWIQSKRQGNECKFSDVEILRLGPSIKVGDAVFPKLRELQLTKRDILKGDKASRLPAGTKVVEYQPGRSYTPDKRFGSVSFKTVPDIQGQVSLVLKHTEESETFRGLLQAKSLRRLRIHNAVSLKDLSVVGQLQELRVLELIECSNLQDLSHLSKLRQLEELSIVECTAPIGASELKPLANLKSLRVAWCANLEAEAFASLRLHQLDLSGTTLHDFSFLATQQDLSDLTLDHAMHLDNLTPILELMQLSRLVVTSCPQLARAERRKMWLALPNCRVYSDFSER